jgi:hypothetical protein
MKLAQFVENHSMLPIQTALLHYSVLYYFIAINQSINNEAGNNKWVFGLIPNVL